MNASRLSGCLICTSAREWPHDTNAYDCPICTGRGAFVSLEIFLLTEQGDLRCLGPSLLVIATPHCCWLEALAGGIKVITLAVLLHRRDAWQRLA